jgi:hypothetical protein
VIYEPVNKNNHIDLVIAYTIKLSRARNKKNICFFQKINLDNMYRNNTKALPMVPKEAKKALSIIAIISTKMTVMAIANDMNWSAIAFIIDESSYVKNILSDPLPVTMI